MSTTVQTSQISSRSHSVLAAATSDLQPVGLDAVRQAADLQQRIDRKYLLSAEQFDRLTMNTGGRFMALEIDRLRVFNYESVYFDTADRQLYRTHSRGRPKRYKVRTRSYLDSGECLFEVKVKGRRGETIKHRMPYSLGQRDLIDDAAQMFLAGVLQDAYGIQPPQLRPVVTTRYRRGTLVDLEDGARLTCDVDLSFSDDIHSVKGPDRVLVESKSIGHAAADRILRELGVRPISISKYSIGTALLRPSLPANRWNRILRREFGWSRNSLFQTAGQSPTDS